MKKKPEKKKQRSYNGVPGEALDQCGAKGDARDSVYDRYGAHKVNVALHMRAKARGNPWVE